VIDTVLAWTLIVAPIPLWLLMCWENRQIYRAKLARRADEQHAALLAGDELLGVHGAYPPPPEYGWLFDDSVALHESVLRRLALARWAGENYGI